jgi:membrane protease YdiL (CAAX protease family)
MSPLQDLPHTQDRNDRLVASWEIVSLMISTLIAQWAISVFADNARFIAVIPILLALGLMIISHRLRKETLIDLGFRFDNFWPAFRLLWLPTLTAIAFIVLGGWILAHGISLRPLRPRLLVIPAWAIFQQYALQGYINRRAQIALDRGMASIAVVAMAFGVLHLPSPLLSSLAFVGAFVWAWVYQKYPNLPALVLSHTLISWTLALTIPQSLTQHLRIGFKYFGLDI